jgi:sensory rhodopsin
MNILALTTSYTFEFTFISMIAASFYFLLERHKLSDKYKSISSLAFLTTALAVIEYYKMSDFFDLKNLSSPSVNYPTEFRYITWLIATPLMLYIFFVLSGFYKSHKKTVMTTLSLNFAMIVTGYFAETTYSNKLMNFNFSITMFAIGFICWLGIVYVYTKYLPEQLELSPSKNQKDLGKCLNILGKLVVFGWALYPAGLFITFYDPSIDTALTRELIYNFGDLFNKIGFSLICFLCAVKLSKNEAK